MALLGQVRNSSPSAAPLGHAELTKTLWHFQANQETVDSLWHLLAHGVNKNAKTFESKNKNKNKNENESKNKNENISENKSENEKENENKDQNSF